MRTLLFLSALIIAASANGQVTSLSETFDGACATAGLNYPTSWTEYHKPTDDSMLAWNCTPLYGVGSSGCQQVNGYYGTSAHLDSAWLITPQLNLSSYSTIYLRFQSKFRFGGDKIAVMVSHNYTGGYPDSSVYTWTDMSSSLIPNLGTPDSLGWVTHTLDLTSIKSTPLYVAFRYTSSNTACSRWNLENVFTATTNAVSEEASNSYGIEYVSAQSAMLYMDVSVPEDENYRVSVYDMTGKLIESQMLALHSGKQHVDCGNINVAGGLYIIRLTGKTNCYTAKLSIH